MITLRHSNIEIGCCVKVPAEVLWDLLTDTDRWAEWGPSVVAVRCRDRHIREGSQGWVKTVFGFWVPFVVTDWEDGHFWHWSVFGLRATGHRVEALDTVLSRLVFEVPVLAAPYVIICKIALHNVSRLASRANRVA
jgi:hypothetical protein